MATIPDNVYSAPRIGRTGHSEHLKAFGADRSLDHWFTGFLGRVGAVGDAAGAEGRVEEEPRRVAVAFPVGG